MKLQIIILAALSGVVLARAPASAAPPTETREDILCRATSGVGFSYHWGGACWCAAGCSPDFSCDPGSCSGSCPSCTHYGTYGADCSGFTNKCWQVPDPSDLTYCSHGPYVSGSMTVNGSYWTVIDRSQAQLMDAFASSSHILLYESGDPWGYIWAYEAKGCSYGIVHNERTCSASYAVAQRTNLIAGECTPGQVETQGCGNCGTQSRTCDASYYWGAWGACTGEGPCSPNAYEEEACCDLGGGYTMCGTHGRTCGGDCQWGGWGTCSGPDPNGGNNVCWTGECGICNEGRERCDQGCVVCSRINDPVTEICDHIDNDCDCDTDEGLPLYIYYADTDGDGYGDHYDPEVDCGLFPGFVENDLDCDDNDASQHPGATEVCNYEDDDCDDEIDEGVRPTYYWDHDLDEWGNVTITTMGFCSLADANADVVDGQWVEDSGDCDDENWEFNPGAEEICDGLDNDCDGVVDDGACVDMTVDPLDGDGDGFTEMAGDCDDGDWSVYPGAPEICDGLDNDCDPATEIDEGTECWDGDDDGFAPIDGDCDDEDPTSYPGAPEVTDDERDNDCDGVIDEDPAADTDGDGFSEDDGDCNDGNQDIHPDALEVPDDLLDNDCDGIVDELVPAGCVCAALPSRSFTPLAALVLGALLCRRR